MTDQLKARGNRCRAAIISMLPLTANDPAHVSSTVGRRKSTLDWFDAYARAASPCGVRDD